MSNGALTGTTVPYPLLIPSISVKLLLLCPLLLLLLLLVFHWSRSDDFGRALGKDIIMKRYSFCSISGNDILILSIFIVLISTLQLSCFQPLKSPLCLIVLHNELPMCELNELAPACALGCALDCALCHALGWSI